MYGIRRLKRQQRLWLTGGTIFVAALAAASGAVLWPRRVPSYNPAEKAEGITAELERKVPVDHPRIRFADVAQDAGISFRHFWKERSTRLPEDMGSGAAWGDYDNDGDHDLFVVNICGPLTLSPAEARQSPATCRLYRNNGDGTFRDVTERAGLALRTCGMACAWGDYNADGWLDLVITSYPNVSLFRNNGDQTFTEVSQTAGIGHFRGFWAGASWADYDRDTDLDLYVCGYVRYRFDKGNIHKLSLQYQGEVPFTLNPSSYPPEPNLLFGNNGDGTFTELARQVGIDNPTGRSLTAAWCDFDDDGWLDLYVANDISDNAMFRNLGDGRFRDVSYPAGVADYRGAMGLAIGDWDGDSDFDIFVTHWIAQENGLFQNMSVPSLGQAPIGELLFMDVADRYGLGQVALNFIGWGTSFFDYDNDGRPDLFVANGSTFQDEHDPSKLIPMPLLLFWNGGPERGFFEVGAVSGNVFQKEEVSRGAACADYDNDGDIDLFVVNHSDHVWLLRNDGGNQNQWLKVRAQGPHDRFGIGAKVQIVVGQRQQTEQIGSQASYLCQNALEAHFGLGQAPKVDKLTVTFPSGHVVEMINVPANQTIVVRETDSTVEQAH